MILPVLAFGFLSNRQLPDVVGVDRRVHRLGVEARGRPIAVVFISHDCPVCNTYAPELARIAAKYGRRVLFGLAYAEPNLSPAGAQAHAQAYGLTGAELLRDPRGILATACGATITPEAAVFDGSGRRIYLGRIDDLYYDLGKPRPAATRHDLRAALDSVLAHRPATPASGPPFGCVIEVSAKP